MEKTKDTNLDKFRLHEGKISNHSTLNMSIRNSKNAAHGTKPDKSSDPSFPRRC